jgi:arrestin-related trafficking adapter 3/6
MTGPVILSYYTSRGTIFYTPTNRYLEKSQPARLPSPPCRPRTRRPHSIHITRLPVGFVPLDLRPPPPVLEPKEASRFQIKLKKLASRENAKRVLGSVFSPFTSSNSTAPSSAAASTRPASPQTLRTSFSSASADPTTIYARRAAAGTVVDDSPVAMSRPSLGGNPPGVAPRHSLSANSVNSAIAVPVQEMVYHVPSFWLNPSYS